MDSTEPWSSRLLAVYLATILGINVSPMQT
jgi:hypothetical protein